MNNPRISHSLVAFVDVLGFSENLISAKTEEDVQGIFKKIKQLHDIFDKDPKEPSTLGAQEAMAQSVLSMSDSIIISVDFNSPFGAITPRLDFQAIVLCDLARAQAMAVIEGIFLRGGIAKGYFCHEDSIILSDALVKAYNTEKDAFYPIIALDDDFCNEFLSDPHNKCYAPPYAPANSLIKECSHPITGQIIHYVDYFGIAISECSSWDSQQALDEYRATDDNDEKNRILSESYLRSELKFVDAHANAIRSQLNNDYSPKVRMKYEWLANYHNDSVDSHNYDPTHKIRIVF